MAETLSNPEQTITLDRTVDRSKSPGLWPQVDARQGVTVSPLLNKHQWLVMIKEQSLGSLSADQRRLLSAIGFRKGTDGRHFYPGYPTPRVVSQICSVFDCPTDVLMPDQVVTVTPQDTFKPNIPLEVQAGVRWYWKNRPRALRDEIKDSLDGREDEISATTLRMIESEKLENMVRLQVLVGQALEGEITPVTEPILSMGLYRGSAGYGPTIADWPDDLQTFHQTLAEARGETPPETLAIDPLHWRTNDPRPAHGLRIQWDTATQRKTGYVVGHGDDPKELWAVALGGAERSTDVGFLFPKREKIPLESVVGYESKPDTAQEAAETFEPPAPTTANNTKPQRPVTLTDLPNLKYANLESGEILSDSDKQQVALALKLGRLMGNHPLLMLPNRTPEAIASWLGMDDMFVYRPLQDQITRAKIDGEIVIRDKSLEWFNAAQPETPEGKRSPVAVLPAPVPVITDIEFASAPELVERIEQFQFCRVGIHPLFIEKIRTALDIWSEEEASKTYDPTGELIPQLRSVAGFHAASSLNLSQLSFSMGDQAFQAAVRKFYNDTLKSVGAPEKSVYNLHLDALTSLLQTDTQEALSQYLHGMAFTSYAEAQAFLAGDHPRYQEVVNSNKKLLKSLVDLSDRSLETIWKTRHPIFVVLDELNNLGLAGAGRAESLAMLNIDLAEHTNWLGQMAQMNGVTLDAVHSHRVTEVPSDEAREKFGLGDYVRPLPRAMITTGLLTRQGQTEPFQIVVVAESEELLQRQIQSEKIGLHEPNLFHQEDDRRVGSHRFESLGRLVDLNAMAPIDFGDRLTRDNQVVTRESRANLTPTVIGIEDFGKLETHPVSARVGLSRIDTTRALEGLPQRTIEFSSPQVFREASEYSFGALETMIPSWRNQDEKRQQVLDAIRLWAADFKPLKNLAKPDRIAADVLDKLVSQPDGEMVVMAAKSTSRRVKYHMQVVSQEDTLSANGNRNEAIERKTLQIKNYDRSTVKGWQFGTFDVVTVLRPEALRYLNELRANERLNDKASEDAKTARRGARQDKGMVAGLAIKDLRGSASTILNNIASAGKEDQVKFVTKTKLWDTPDWIMLRSPTDEDRNNGERPMEPLVAAFFEQLRKETPMKPPANIAELNLIYTRYVLGLRDAFNDIRTEDELKTALRPEGRLAKLLETIYKDAEDQGCPDHLLAGKAGLRHFYDKMIYGGIFLDAQRKSLKNTVWPIKETQGRGGRTSEDDEDDRPQVGAMPMLSRLIRKGAEDYRGGTSVNEQTVIATFGFSGIEYGKSMTQKDRETYLNEAYDGFLDLANVMNVPPQAMSLGGTLGLAFGSRGKGGRNAALAHFEPSNNAINLTRMRGAGSMAHEFGHALANYLFRLSRGVQGSRSPGDITTTLDRQVAPKSTQFEGGQLRQPVTDAIAMVLRSLKYSPIESDADRLKPSFFARGAVNADSRKNSRSRSKSEPYWASIEEMFARAFETYVDVALKEQNPDFRNDFLVRPDKLTVWGKNVEDARERLEKARPEEYELADDATDEQRKAWRENYSTIRDINRQTQGLVALYPSGEELKIASKAFKKLFETLETRQQPVIHDHLGEIELPLLYSHDTESIARITDREQAILAHCIMEEVARMCGDEVWVAWHQELRDQEGNPVAGRYRDKDSAHNTVRSVIDLAYGAPLSTAHHEAFHFAQSHLLTERELNQLDRDFQAGEPLHERLISALIHQGKHELVNLVKDDPRESQAYAYEMWVQGNLDIRKEERPVSIFGRIRKFFDRALGLSENAGFRSSHDIFQAFHQGQLVRREQAQKMHSHQESGPGKPGDSSNATPANIDTKNEESSRRTIRGSDHHQAMSSAQDPDEFNTGPQPA